MTHKVEAFFARDLVGGGDGGDNHEQPNGEADEEPELELFRLSLFAVFPVAGE